MVRDKNNEIFINEQLTARAATLFFHVRQTKREKNYLYAWTRDGNIYIRKAATTQKIKIKNLNDLLEVQ